MLSLLRVELPLDKAAHFIFEAHSPMFCTVSSIILGFVVTPIKLIPLYPQAPSSRSFLFTLLLFQVTRGFNRSLCISKYHYLKIFRPLKEKYFRKMEISHHILCFLIPPMGHIWCILFIMKSYNFIDTSIYGHIHIYSYMYMA